MGIVGLIASLFAPASELGKSYIDGKNKIENAKILAEVSKWNSKAAAYENDAGRTHGWEMEALRQSQHSYKDEFWTVVLAVILMYPIGMGAAGVFLQDPMYKEALDASWSAYKDMPLAFQMLYPFVILASMGIRYKGKTEAATAIKNLGG